MNSKLNVVQYNASLQKLASSFHSGNWYLDQFLRQNIALDENYGKTYILLSQNNKCIIGYYNLSTGYLESVEENQVRKIGGAVHINCFALTEQYQGILQELSSEGMKIKFSDYFFVECLNRIREIQKEKVGFSFITLCSTMEGYHLYYRNGFNELDSDMHFSVEEAEIKCIPMYMAMDLEE